VGGSGLQAVGGGQQARAVGAAMALDQGIMMVEGYGRIRLALAGG
jgi:hypothetical protein